MYATYSRTAILDWFHRTLGVNSQPNPDEIQTDCPQCGGNVLYFNIKKRVGICHSASCEWHSRVFLRDLIAIVGFAPNQGGEWEPIVEDKGPIEIKLPGHPVLAWMSGTLCMNLHAMHALEYLRSRGLDDRVILNFGLTCDGSRVYVPIYDNNDVLVNYNSRILPGYSSADSRKYLYCPGAKTSHYILGWNECRDWQDLALVENTFVSLAYRYRMRCSTTFGSNISDVQADLIGRESGIRRVALLWDENAENGANRAMAKLQARGIRSAAWKILGQPDDYPIEWVDEKRRLLLQAATDGVKWLDFRDECVRLQAPVAQLVEAPDSNPGG